VLCAVPDRRAQDPKLVGANLVRVLPGTRLAGLMGEGPHEEGFFCNYEVNEPFAKDFERAGLTVAALGPHDEMRAVELAGHPFFIATLFQPQLTSKATGAPHRLIQGYLVAIAG